MSDETRCCVEHLQRMGDGVIANGQFIIHPNHCVDGRKRRCSKCNRTWEHVCDEAEGCSWVLRSVRRKAAEGAAR